MIATLGGGIVIAANKFEKPKSVIHVVTVRWKDGTTPEQIKAALDGVEKLAANYPGIKRVWTRSVKVQDPRPMDKNNPNDPRFTHAFVMEFESEEALKNYADSPAQKEWYTVYVPVRLSSATHDITN
jgi:hypothetical protein